MQEIDFLPLQRNSPSGQACVRWGCDRIALGGHATLLNWSFLLISPTIKPAGSRESVCAACAAGTSPVRRSWP
jgi:hypothetical protein